MREVMNSWFGPADSRFGAWEYQPNQGSFGRLWRAFMTARVLIAGLLLLLQAVIYSIGNTYNAWSVAITVAYLCATMAVRLWSRPKPPENSFDAQWVSTVGVDLATFFALNFLQASGINYMLLFALPVLLASVLGTVTLALGTAASVTLFLLADAWWISLESMGDLTSRFLQAGLSGFGFFAVALLASQLALRLAREEQLTKNSQSVARMQTEVNELVLETLTDGVLVVDENGIVRSANPAARRLLAAHGTTRSAPFVLATEVAWQPLAEILRQTYLRQVPQEADVSLEHLGHNGRRLHVRTRLAGSDGNSHESLCVMFLEDLREMEARVRVEKLAAMGRMSAAVAHEIRNPLAAISQANALLAEDLQDAGHRQLTTMVAQNAQRLAKIVDEILNISRAQVDSGQVLTTLGLDDAVARVCNDWTRQTASQKFTQLALDAHGAAVVFDAEHLRRVLINLLDNARRYASRGNGALEVSTRQVAGQAHLHVWSDGKPLEDTVKIHLFEPFFSSETHSSGLGLYICRELCERHGAVIGYHRASRHGIQGNEFFVIFKPADPEDLSARTASDNKPLAFDSLTA